ncbi:hypothetical protein RSSM_04063 [Rhodopirellula sallentina SM41]|uniref:Uncharacterized protein n=1 Tax=Rhodopirellula sallentina SM41 TaxID=1263870 RepID=M5UEN8_9BACT|nr:hypothetical protein RSSM_04063 [Rhodopirellula sallentina SM41]
MPHRRDAFILARFRCLFLPQKIAKCQTSDREPNSRPVGKQRAPEKATRQSSSLSLSEAHSPKRGSKSSTTNAVCRV